MNITEILKIFSDPGLIKTLSLGDLTVGIFVSIFLGMGVTFVVLVLLLVVIMVFSRVLSIEIVAEKEPVQDGADKDSGLALEDELVAVLTSAVAAVMRKPVDSIAIKNIKEIN
ncbi:MAG: OadG family transporter subunit [Spirochaetota bacterium]